MSTLETTSRRSEWSAACLRDPVILMESLPCRRRLFPCARVFALTAADHTHHSLAKLCRSVDEVKEGKAGGNYKTFLVQRGKKVQNGMKAGPGDVWQAVKEKDVGRVRQLLESEYDPDEYDMSHGGTPLHQAVWDGETVSIIFFSRRVLLAFVRLW